MTKTVYKNPIDFSPKMMEANIARKKVVTRRIPSDKWRRIYEHFLAGEQVLLWCRYDHYKDRTPHCGTETIWDEFTKELHFEGKEWTAYRNDILRHKWDKERPGRLPRWASGFTCEVTNIRTDILSRISGKEAIQEGVGVNENGTGEDSIVREGQLPGGMMAISMFKELWDSIHNKDGERFADNPLVYVIEYNFIKTNVNKIAKGDGDE